ncbi:unnamed protein product (macronuclear) [Paramecium tetraurelia]|uniref:Uncharacterized protein n=1 Tax=Paramecium tetraurelia TaxID=5888 RepID=A0DC69_PARTE|nr:uncharacterized protein GSPATT00015513001 [Paramecium tetraurelia]CAK80636.1 unnamed protein product [Paramecium tetraurelia]|eukprot:XP_001448033.1 hypothetical protein (macronuclear) [Paramecium tetraurelia strain d4-2]
MRFCTNIYLRIKYHSFQANRNLHQKLGVTFDIFISDPNIVTTTSVAIYSFDPASPFHSTPKLFSIQEQITQKYFEMLQHQQILVVSVLLDWDMDQMKDISKLLQYMTKIHKHLLLIC